jgi:hypothetical protein
VVEMKNRMVLYKIGDYYLKTLMMEFTFPKEKDYDYHFKFCPNQLNQKAIIILKYNSHRSKLRIILFEIASQTEIHSFKEENYTNNLWNGS